MDIDIFGDVDKSKLRLAKPTAGTPPEYISKNEPISSVNIRKLKPVSSGSSSVANSSVLDSNLTIGNIVMHERFGKGEIVGLEGAGADKKAEIRFDVGGLKKLL
jgi:DNA helicase-2/ATP-dependent DNA helicase PcrA